MHSLTPAIPPTTDLSLALPPCTANTGEGEEVALRPAEVYAVVQVQ